MTTNSHVQVTEKNLRLSSQSELLGKDKNLNSIRLEMQPNESQGDNIDVTSQMAHKIKELDLDMELSDRYLAVSIDKNKNPQSYREYKQSKHSPSPARSKRS